VVTLDHPARGRQPETGAAMLRREERLEDPAAHVFGNPGAFVRDRDGRGAVAGVNRNPDRSPVSAGLGGVEQQVQKRGLELLDVRLQDRPVA